MREHKSDDIFGEDVYPRFRKIKRVETIPADCNAVDVDQRHADQCEAAREV